MLINLPFLADSLQDDDENVARYSFTGGYPVNCFLEWHNGVHLIAPVDRTTGYSPVRAVADGKLIYVRTPQTTPNPQQNYGAFSDNPEWTDNGIVILQHDTEIGAAETTPVSIRYFSVYMHLKSLGRIRTGTAKAPGPERDLAVGDTLFRKHELGTAGQIYSQDAHLHFEICMDEANLKKLIGRDPTTPSNPDTLPKVDGRTDAVWGSTYIFLPETTPTLSFEPKTHHATTGTTELKTALWVQIEYAGNAKLTSFFAKGDSAGEPIFQSEGASCVLELNGEYELYQEAAKRNASLSKLPVGQSNHCGWYDLLRFGRAFTPNPPIAAGLEHWRKIRTPIGDRWADLNALGTHKFSDADFPSFLGWQFIGDDANGGNALDQRCDSPTLRTLLARQIADLTQRTDALKKTSEGRMKLAKQALQPRTANFKRKLPRLICRFPTEFDRNTFETRYSHVKDEPHFKEDATGQNWTQLKTHIESICCPDFPDAYKAAQWHFHPVAFIETLGKCAWLQKADVKRIYTEITDDHLNAVRNELNKCSSRHFLNTALRQSHFFGQVRQEAGPGMKTKAEDLSYPPQKLRSTFSYYEKHPLEADSDGYLKDSTGRITRPALQENIANKAYYRRGGNLAPNDGWLYRGRGIKQLTGRSNYNDFTKGYKSYWPDTLPDFLASPDLLIESVYGIRSAVWFWISNACMRSADRGSNDRDIDSVTAIVNKGELGRANADGSFTLAPGSKPAKRREYMKSSYRILS